jgi:vacuolar-type H+-ATPase subunit F/Vma7
MMVRVVTRPTLAAGFQLAGLAPACVDDAAGALDVIKQWASDGDVGIVLVDAALYEALPRDALARLDRQAVPMIAPVPVPRWDERSEAEALILEILRQAIGYRVRAR